MENWTLRDILEIGLGEYLRTNRLPLFLHKAAQAMRRCRTAALGGHLGYCKKCDVEKAFYNSCGHRACPQCAFLKTEAWLEKKADQLLACDHFHLTFTVPQSLHRLWRYDYRNLTALGFQALWDTLRDLLADPKYMGALPGLHVTFHSWNRSALFFPHFHALVTGGGLGADGTWKKARRPNSLVATEVMSVVFKAKFRDGFRQLLRKGELTLPPDTNEQDALFELNQALSQKWVVDRQKPYRHGKGVLTYFARYARGGAVKNRRIEAVEDGMVTFRKSRRNEVHESITLPIGAFIERLLQHVPPPYFRTSRSYGLYAPTSAAKRALCEAALGKLKLCTSDAEVQAEIPGSGDIPGVLDACPVCGQSMEVVWEMPRPGAPLTRRLKALARPPPALCAAPERGTS